MFDLNVLPLYFIDTQEQPRLPGLICLAPPRRAARGRERDQLVLLASLLGGVPLTSEALERLAQTYFRSSGAVTSALRACLEGLNEHLMERNLHGAGAAGSQAIGLVNLVVVHEERLYVAQSGPTHAFLLANAGVQDFYDPQLAGRGLGVSRAVTVRYFQAELAAGQSLVLCAEPPSSWTPANLAGSSALSLEALRRLLSLSQPNLSAVLVQFQAGAGKVTLLSAGSLASETPQAAGATPNGATPAGAAPQAPRRLHGAPRPPLESASPSTHPAETPPESRPLAASPARANPILAQPPAPALEPASAPGEENEPALPGEEAPAVAQPRATRAARAERARNTRRDTLPFLRATAAFLRGSRQAGQRSGSALGRLLKRLLPGGAGAESESAGLPRATLFFLAVAVPLVVVAVAMAVYFQSGRSEQYRANFTLAEAQAAQTSGQTDPQVLRDAWEKALYYLDKAESYQKTDASQALRVQAQTQLDQIDGIQRLQFQPAILGGLAGSVDVVRMAANANDLYMLDATQGRVLRAILTGRGYEIDSNFACGPGPSGTLVIGNLVDMIAISPSNEFQATVMALDGNGNLIYCTPGQGFTAVPLAPPDNNWGKIEAMTYDGSSLYVLDPPNNAVWVYDGGIANFTQRPRLFFDNEIPPMGDVTDLAIANQNLYLLHADGHTTQCTFSYASFEPTHCTDPAPYSDDRPGREAQVTVFPDVQFNQAISSALPTPALYYLEPVNASIYLFSLQLRLQNQLRADTTSGATLPSKTATAFTVSPNRLVFLAFGNQVFYAAGQ